MLRRMGHGHRLFAACWDRSSRHEGAQQRQARREVAAGLRGRVLEIGVGVGTNWRYLPDGVIYVGIEPDAYMVARARRHADEQGRHVSLVQVPAEHLPFADGAFDTVFATLTLCTIDDVPLALAEIRRVLKPGGEFRFWEHVRPRQAFAGKLFDAITPAWKAGGGGCRPNRRTAEAVAGSGLEMRSLRRERMGPLPVIAGVAVNPSPA
jgi:ubiquinone/menaquinone biosynthesis C-methylase UbiE